MSTDLSFYNQSLPREYARITTVLLNITYNRVFFVPSSAHQKNTGSSKAPDTIPSNMMTSIAITITVLGFAVVLIVWFLRRKSTTDDPGSSASLEYRQLMTDVSNADE